MPHIRSKTSWRAVLAGKTTHAMAEQIIGDLTGYRSTSKYRADDTDGMFRWLALGPAPDPAARKARPEGKAVKAIIILGDVVNGFTFIGPFEHVFAADEWSKTDRAS